MKTIKRYLDDRNLYFLQTDILDVIPNSDSKNSLLLVLKETVFFPGGGGQSCDTGTIKILGTNEKSNSEASSPAESDLTLPITETFERDGEIYHRVSLNPLGTDNENENVAESSPASIFVPGAKCEIEIDWERRFDNMQRHCGEHILSGVFYDLYGGVNRGFHMGEDYMTIDISMEDNPDYSGKDLTWDMAVKAEDRANEIIWSNLPVIPHHFDKKEDAKGMQLRKELTIEEDITIVTIGSPDNPADSVACCGTHPHYTGSVGLLKIYKVEPNKGMFRVFFDAGKRAMAGYQKRFDILSCLEKDLSAGVPDILDKYSAKQEKQKEVRDRLYHLTRSVLEKEKERILSEGNSLYRYSILSLDDLIELGRALDGKLDNVEVLFMLHEPTNTLLLFSDKQDCGKLVKDNVQVFGGKGGGNRKFARAIFSRPDDTEMFIAAINNLLR